MYALSAGCGSFRRRPFSASPCPPLAAARVGGRARSRVPGRPPGSCPRRSGCSSRRLRARVPFCGLWPPLRSALRLAPLLRPFPRSRGAPGRCGASSRPFALGSRSLRAGSPVPPCPAPFGGSRALAPPGGAPAGAACAAPFCASVAPPGVGVGAAAAAAAARLRLSVSLPGACFGVSRLAAAAAAALRACCSEDEGIYLNKIRRAVTLSAQEIFHVN